jgi:DNA-binding HxlR family transcriptional regulator
MLDKDVMDSLLSEIPSEVFDTISPLSNKNSQAIFIALLKNEQMRFGQIKELFHVTNSEDINHPLKSLVKAGLVAKKAEYLDDIGETEKAVYSSTFMGKSVMRSLYKGVMIGDNVPITRSPIIPTVSSGKITVYFAPDYAPNNQEKPNRINPNLFKNPQIPLAIGGGPSK